MKTRIKQEPEKEVPTEVLASSIVAIAEGVKKLRAGRLNEKGLVLLIVHACPGTGGYGRNKVGVTEVKAVLAGLENLEATYLKKPVAAR